MVEDEANIAVGRAPPPWRVLHEVDVARMVAQHAKLRDLCNELEECADEIPARDAIIKAISISAALAECLRHHAVVESTILRSLFENDATLPVNGLLGRIRHRHTLDHLHAEDLRDALGSAARSLEPVRSDTLSYMMRCLFDGCRRGIDFQEAAILMLANDRLTRDARAALGASLAGAH